MAWAQRMQDAKFRGIAFEMLSVSDQGGHALAVHEYPYQDGAALDDQGAKGRQVRVKAIFRGDAYEEQLENFIHALNQRGAGQLVHPIFGALTVKVQEWVVDHSTEIVDGAVLAVTFLEDGLQQPVFSRAVVDQGDMVTAQAVAGREVAVRSVARAVDVARAAGDFPRLNALRTALTGAIRRLRAALDFSPLRAILSDLDPILYPRAWANDFLAIIDRAFQGLPFGGVNDLFDRVAVGVALQAVGGVATPLEQGRMTEFALVQRALAPQLQDLPAVELGLVPADRAAVQGFIRVACSCSVAEAAAMVLVAEVQDRVLGVPDLERVAAGSRELLQAALDQVRTGFEADDAGPLVDALRRQAVAVQQLALDAIRLRPPLVSRAAPVGGHWRLVAHALYGDATRAPELSRLNNSGRRLFVRPREEVRAYAR
ncbi:MAG: DNA circularization protein [Ramlibacter sp.]